ncbi:hypothetical protein ZWY2020_025996 [Hordeum vulgare]|nr:hypothetical protein ZWY2020_025996 [Hordeum vulgare]
MAPKRAGCRGWPAPTSSSTPATRTASPTTPPASAPPTTGSASAINTPPTRAQSAVSCTAIYVLHNPFSNTSLPLPELDAVLVHHMSLVRKFLMRSTVDDLIALITNNTKHPLVVFRRGKGVWSPKPRPASPYV